jgi:hypothetical protein
VITSDTVFGNITRAIAATGKSPENTAVSVYLGRAEWRALHELCVTWGVDGWPPGGKSYNPDTKRARIQGAAIYVVDAESHLAAI